MVAAEKTTHLDFVKMLKSYGGDDRVCAIFSDQGKAIIGKAKHEICNENKELLKVCTDSEFSVFPKELKDLIIIESFSVGRSRALLLKV